MWRAFFFAVGTMLIILGMECLVAERFVVTQGRVSKVLGKILDEKPAASGNLAMGNFPQNAMTQSFAGQGARKQGGPNTGLPFGSSANGGSKYGPSRFNDDYTDQPQYGRDYYGGMPSNQRQANQPFTLAGFGARSGGPARAATGGPGFFPMQMGPVALPRQAKILTPKEWMPWSLLAAGSLVVLYTKSTSKRSYSNES